jgi:hypothetical protein
MSIRKRLAIPYALEARALGEAQRRAMFALYERYYDAATYARFSADLDDKTYALVIYDTSGALQGFSTLASYERAFAGRRVRVLFSGDTVVDESHWGQQALAFSWLRLAGRFKRAEPEIPLYWLLISKGYRTYRYLRAFSREFWPAPDRAAPPHRQELMHFLARDRFGADYDAAAGVVRFPQSRGHLRAPYDRVPERHRRLPEVEFFLTRNPGYVRGDELVCLCELAAGNLRPIARRAFLEAAETDVVGAAGEAREVGQGGEAANPDAPSNEVRVGVSAAGAS